jgi:predicted double-glycine peptidase
MTSGIPNVFRLNLKSYQQSKDYSCGAACAKTTLESFGVIVPEAFIAHTVKTSERHGTYAKDLVEIFRDMGLDAKLRVKGEFEDIQRALLDGRKALVLWSDWGGHWVCVDGWETPEDGDWRKDMVVFADPYDMTDSCSDGYVRVVRSRFESMWVDWQYAGKVVRNSWIDVGNPSAA